MLFRILLFIFASHCLKRWEWELWRTLLVLSSSSWWERKRWHLRPLGATKTRVSRCWWREPAWRQTWSCRKRLLQFLNLLDLVFHRLSLCPRSIGAEVSKHRAPPQLLNTLSGCSILVSSCSTFLSLNTVSDDGGIGSSLRSSGWRWRYAAVKEARDQHQDEGLHFVQESDTTTARQGVSHNTDKFSDW